MRSPTTTISKSNPRKRKESKDRFQGDMLDLDGRIFSAFFDCSDTGLAVADPDGRFVRVNPSLCNILGHTERKLIGRRLQHFIMPDFWSRLSTSIADIISGRENRAQLDLECCHRDGNGVNGVLTLSLAADRAGAPRCLVVQIQDLSSLTRAESEMKKSRQWFKALSDATFEAVFISREGICIDANQTASKMFGIPQEDLIGIFGTDVIDPAHKAVVREKMLSGNEEPYRVVAVKRDGTRFHVEIQGKMARIDGSDVRVTVVRDIDAQVKAEAALRESERHLRSLMESASNFVLFRLRHCPENPCQPQQVFISPSIAEIVDLTKVSDFQSWLKMIHPDDKDRLLDAGRKLLETHRLDEMVRILDRSEKGWRWLHIISVAVTDETDDNLFLNGIILDITSKMETTAALKVREEELKKRTESLSDVNTALEVLLRKREADRLEVEEKLLSNIKSLILPYLEKLKTSRLDDRQQIYLNLVEANLNELISPLSRRMSRYYLNFTPLEIQVANLVKEGKTTKDIAIILGLSIRTIEAVRYTIRRKLGIKKKRSNLRSYLLSIDGAEAIRGGSRRRWGHLDDDN
jgi:PAS domain S-box-containing protein